MTPINAFFELLRRVGSCQGNAVLVNTEELHQWPGEAVRAMKSQRLLVKARPGGSAICPGCEDNCVMPVHKLPATTGAGSSFIVCDKRSDVNRVPVSSNRLSKWQCCADLVCEFIASSLSLRTPARQTGSAGRWEIGIVSGWDRFLAYAWEGGTGQRLLVAINYGPSQGQCHVAWPFVDVKGKQVTLKDLMHEARYEWEGDALLDRGLYVDLPSWGFHVFAW